MTTKLHQKITTVLAGIAIIVLVTIIVLVWVQIGHTAFRSKSPNYGYHGYNETSTQETPADTYLEGNLKYQEKEIKLIESSHLDDLGKQTDVEFVKPMKISPPPLHDHDIIYDQLHNTADHPPLRHHSGHFRHKAAEIWDPHPNYEITAFGKKLELELAFNDKFMAPNLEVTHFWENYTKKAMQDSKTFGCFYTGKVKGEENSDVAVSLCNGMTGYIRTSETNYYIEPAEKFENYSVDSILHRIRKIDNPTEITNEIQSIDEADQLCEAKENSTIIDDDFLLPYQEHVINKRNPHYDYVDASNITNFKKRFTRSIPWPSGDHRSKYGLRKNQEYYVEIMIVVDKTMVHYHSSEEDLIHYIMTLMSHVALLYKDATIGNPISLSVVKVWILKNIQFTSVTSGEMLKKFCDWQARDNTENSHDVALLLTRDVVCKNATAEQCNTLGVAEVGSMCSPTSSCAIVKDKGLSTSYTIAHELGHILSMVHDEDDRCPQYSEGLASRNIMSRVLYNDTKPWMWSPCSKHLLTEFLESSKASCLLNLPNNDIISSKFPKVLPGEAFEVDKQCELEFGKGHRLCPYEMVNICSVLWCTKDDIEGCKTHHMPWADGTPCGDLSWCHHGKCVNQDRSLLQPVPGGWGEWEDWGPCSRSCGGGISVSKRSCNNPPPSNGGAYCSGTSTRYSSCNVQACDPDVPDFREAQCAKFNGFKGAPGLKGNIDWIPKYGLSLEDSCSLFCRVKHSLSYYMLERKVIDGTKCGLDTFDICVNGICRPGGCDNRLDSKAVLDECGVCGGDNSKCEEVSGTYNITSNSISSSYKRVIRIPKGSSNLHIVQKGYQNGSADDIYLALVDGETGTYVLNGNFRISQHHKEIIFAGMTISYSGSDTVLEYIKTPKNRKLTKDLVLEILSAGKQQPLDITYRYTIRKDTAPRYGWQLYDQQWSECNAMCDGKQFLQPNCVELSTSAQVPETYCSDLNLDSVVQQKDCNSHCQFIWQLNNKGHCSSQCGQGIRALFHDCVKVYLNNSQLPSVVNERHCSLLSKPSEVETCEGLCESTRWEYDDWTECTKTCGGGIQRRHAECIDSNGKIISDSQCNKDTKVVEQLCNNQKCPVWSFDEWTPCSVTCGKGYRTRPYYCHVNGRSYNIEACDPKLLPVVEEECIERPCIVWHTGNWQECNVSCGEGTQEREVSCRTIDNIIVDEEHCSSILKPNSTKICLNTKCEEYISQNREYESNTTYFDFDSNDIVVSSKHLKFTWITGAWSKCTKSCNTGIKSRMVVCRNVKGEENEYNCDQNERPVANVECNTDSCPEWNYGDWSSCDQNCEQHRQVLCQNAGGNIVKDNLCDLARKPYESVKCNNEYCLVAHPRKIKNDRRNYYNVKENQELRFKWVPRRWSPCSKSCGKGTKTRSVRCSDTVNNVTVVDHYCGQVKKPKINKQCEKNRCNYSWIEGDWSECSQSCGQGYKQRNVTCHKVLRGGYIDSNPLPGRYCDLYNIPSSRMPCILRNCNDHYRWLTGPWEECSHKCGKKGRQRRTLYCINRNEEKVNKRLCLRELRPKQRRKCNRQKCIYRSCKEVKQTQVASNNSEYYLSINGKVARIYCYKMDKGEPEEFITLKSHTKNYAENYDKRLQEPDTCPSSGHRKDDCDCISLGSERSGITMFWKVRLNITSLQIITNDYTFSKQSKGAPVPYGTAGDCYSEKEGCIQGTFFIDLTDTSFRLSKSVQWVHNGNKATSRVAMQEQVAHGKCGGYCGSCFPDPAVGLAVEVT